jgi:hypothetical protein
MQLGDDFRAIAGEVNRSGVEEALTDVAAVAHAGWDGEQCGAGVLDVLVECVVAGEVGLQRDEVLVGIAGVGDEEQPGVEVAESVGPVGEVVATAQDAASVILGSSTASPRLTTKPSDGASPAVLDTAGTRLDRSPNGPIGGSRFRPANSPEPDGSTKPWCPRPECLGGCGTPSFHSP